MVLHNLNNLLPLGFKQVVQRQRSQRPLRDRPLPLLHPQPLQPLQQPQFPPPLGPLLSPLSSEHHLPLVRLHLLLLRRRPPQGSEQLRVLVNRVVSEPLPLQLELSAARQPSEQHQAVVAQQLLQHLASLHPLAQLPLLRPVRVPLGPSRAERMLPRRASEEDSLLRRRRRYQQPQPLVNHPPSVAAIRLPRLLASHLHPLAWAALDPPVHLANPLNHRRLRLPSRLLLATTQEDSAHSGPRLQFHRQPLHLARLRLLKVPLLRRRQTQADLPRTLSKVMRPRSLTCQR